MTETGIEKDWRVEVTEEAKKFSRAMQKNFTKRIVLAERKTPTGLSPDESTEVLTYVGNEFLDMLMCTTVGLAVDVGDLTPEFEERFLANAKDWFKRVRQYHKERT